MYTEKVRALRRPNPDNIDAGKILFKLDNHIPYFDHSVLWQLGALNMESSNASDVDHKEASKQKYLKARAQKWNAEDPYNVESWYPILKEYTFKTVVRYLH
jgi:hypothetical protein